MLRQQKAHVLRVKKNKTRSNQKTVNSTQRNKTAEQRKSKVYVLIKDPSLIVKDHLSLNRLTDCLTNRQTEQNEEEKNLRHIPAPQHYSINEKTPEVKDERFLISTRQNNCQSMAKQLRLYFCLILDFFSSWLALLPLEYVACDLGWLSGCSAFSQPPSVERQQDLPTDDAQCWSLFYSLLHPLQRHVCPPTGTQFCVCVCVVCVCCVYMYVCVSCVCAWCVCAWCVCVCVTFVFGIADVFLCLQFFS